LLSDVVNMLVEFEYNKRQVIEKQAELEEGVISANKLIKEMNDLSQSLNMIEGKQNLLSINARIEAARAGEAGKGFSIVAQEVGSLADSSKQINGKIKEVLSKLNHEVENMVNQNNK